MKVRNLVKLVYDDVEITFKGKGAFNKLEAYRHDLDKDGIDYMCFWKIGYLGIRWTRMCTINMLKSKHNH